MRIAIVGLGSIGRRHLGNARALEPEAEILVVRHRKTEEAPPAGADRVVFTLDEALAARPDVVMICGPTTTHVDTGIAGLLAGAHVFVEKPLAFDATGARTLVETAV